MMRGIALAAAIGAAVALAGCDVANPGLDGARSTELRDIEAFQTIELRGSADVLVVVGGSQRVEVTADTAAQSHITTSVVGGALVIDTTGGWRWNSVDVDVAIAVASLDSFDLTGAGDVVIRGIHGEEFTLAVTGAGDVSLEGAAQRVNVSIDGAGAVNAKELVGADVVALLAGAGEISVNATSTLEAHIDGVGVVDYLGDPRVTKSVDGVGSIDPA